MTLLTKELLAKAAAQDANRQRQIAAQKAVIERLLQARESDTSDTELISELCEERRLLEEHKLELQARIDACLVLVNVLEEGAQQINTDLVREALNG